MVRKHNSDEEPRMEIVERMFYLVQCLLEKECTRKDIFQRLPSYYKVDKGDAETVSTQRADRMFERDLKVLEQLGFEVQKIKKALQPVRYQIVAGSGPLATLSLTTNEISSLALISNMFVDPSRSIQQDPTRLLPQQSSHPFSSDILSLIERLCSALSPEQRKQFESWTRKPYLYFNVAAVADYLSHRETIDTIINAIVHKHHIAFHYKPNKNPGRLSAHNQEITIHQHIDPYFISYIDGHFYLIAYHCDRGKHLEYRIDRIQPRTVDAYPGTNNPQHNRRPIVFLYWLDAGMAQPDLSQRWLEHEIVDRRITKDEQGHDCHWVLIRASAYNDFRIIQQLLKYGEKAEVVEPPSLRERMRKAVKMMMSYYKE
jgi:predicted DNA-binding transcriptional regulator YafY